MESSALSHESQRAQESQSQTPPACRSPERRRVKRISKGHERESDDSLLKQWIAIATRQQEEFSAQFRSISVKLSAFYDAIAAAKEEIKKLVDTRADALDQRISAALARIPRVSDAGASASRTPEVQIRAPMSVQLNPPIPPFFASHSHSPTPNANSSFSCTPPSLIAAPLRLGMTAGNSALAAALQLIFASVWVLQPIQQCPGLLSEFARALQKNRDAACFSLLQTLQKMDQRFALDAASATAFDYFISMLNVAENQVQAPNTAIAVSQSIKNRANSPDLITAFRQSQMARQDTPIQRQCQFEICQERECRCGMEIIYSAAQFLRIAAPRTGLHALQDLIQQQYGVPVQGKCATCASAQISRAFACSTPNQLFIVFDSIMHGQVRFDEFLTLTAGGVTQMTCRYRINAAIVYNGAARYATYVIGEDGTRWLCDEQTIVQRMFETDSPGLFCLSYSRIEK